MLLWLLITLGGPEIVLEEAGKEATEPFDDIGHSDDARLTLQKFKIGVLKGADSKIKKTSSTFAAPSLSASSNMSIGKGIEAWLIRIAFIAVLVALKIFVIDSKSKSL